MPPETPDPKPHGWDAIDAACRGLYGDQEPRHWAPILSPWLGGEDPLQGFQRHVSLTESDAQLLADLVRPKAGTYVLPGLPELQIVVERSEIKDSEGHVIEVIG
jgi:hypothetical protein